MYPIPGRCGYCLSLMMLPIYLSVHSVQFAQPANSVFTLCYSSLTKFLLLKCKADRLHNSSFLVWSCQGTVINWMTRIWSNTNSVGREQQCHCQTVRLRPFVVARQQLSHAPLLVCKKDPGGVVSFVRWGVVLMASFVCVTIETTRSKHGRSCVVYRQCLTYSPLFGHRDPTLGALCVSTFDIHIRSIHLHHVSVPVS